MQKCFAEDMALFHCESAFQETAIRQFLWCCETANNCAAIYYPLQLTSSINTALLHKNNALSGVCRHTDINMTGLCRGPSGQACVSKMQLKPQETLQWI